MKTTTIKVELFPDKEQDFYLSLLQIKVLGSTAIEEYKKLVCAICFDDKIFNSFVSPDREQKKRVNGKLRSIHNYLFNSKKDSPDYLKISKASFSKFKASGFGKELGLWVMVMEQYRKNIGRDESVEVKATAAVFSDLLHGVFNVITQASGEGINHSLNLFAYLQTDKEQSFKITPTEKGTFVFSTLDHTVEITLFLEKDGQIRKTFVPMDMENISGLENANSMLFKIGDTVTQIIWGVEFSELIIYEGIREEKQKLFLSPDKEVQRSVFSNKHTASEIHATAEGSYIVRHSKELENIISKPEPNKKPEKANAAILSKNQRKIVTMTKPGEKPTPLYPYFNELFDFLKPENSKKDFIDKRDKVVNDMYALVTRFYPDTSFHVRCSVTGFISAQMRWLDSEDMHSDLKRRQRYRKYLIDSVTKIVKKNHT